MGGWGMISFAIAASFPSLNLLTPLCIGHSASSVSLRPSQRPTGGAGTPPSTYCSALCLCKERWGSTYRALRKGQRQLLGSPNCPACPGEAPAVHNCTLTPTLRQTSLPTSSGSEGPGSTGQGT